MSVVLALRGPDASPLRLVGPGGFVLNILIWVAAFNLALVPTLLFGGAAQLLAAARGYAGCELFAISNLLRRRDHQIACPVHSPSTPGRPRPRAATKVSRMPGRFE